MASPVRDFIEYHFLHYNARELTACANGFRAHLDAGGKMMVTLAGAMSTARIGRSLAPMIRAGHVHAITCTGANLEEDVFNLLASDRYEALPHWRSLSAEDEVALYERGMNRVTDTAIPEDVMREVEKRMHVLWAAAAADGRRLFPYEMFREVLGQEDLAGHFVLDPAESWMLAAKEAGIPIYTPGWEDSTMGNMFTAWCMREGHEAHPVLRSGTEALAALAAWYRDASGPGTGRPSVGFFQIGGGIAGDFPICAVPMLIQDLEEADTPFWGFFAQISDAVTSYGGYSGAVPNEKITWGKLAASTPKFMIQSDATIVAPLIFAHVLGD
ncbi:deoxyhypusine synthase family protein [Phycisphaera mikurensis]|uniref:Deoxyhypusine synthase-like protein n=1 Tax=Phycisphaera mikurensis (strain NBRC 102666 / KCTC 22515 / FYK2301M01) TaxID=1142394 RepID=I0IAT9_PHYMF|nr:deoxyhypusine synthase family protein [Phycisphaera mikurensis]MBB6442647.1 deoxyhypusine synthase [Phycisphaera mikurensis]BAM02377.1 deoxyhypusine synthase-like protein [Phycisphaera mikurensis NBRC 102666]